MQEEKKGTESQLQLGMPAVVAEATATRLITLTTLRISQREIPRSLKEAATALCETRLHAAHLSAARRRHHLGCWVMSRPPPTPDPPALKLTDNSDSKAHREVAPTQAIWAARTLRAMFRIQDDKSQ